MLIISYLFSVNMELTNNVCPHGLTHVCKNTAKHEPGGENKKTVVNMKLFHRSIINRRDERVHLGFRSDWTKDELLSKNTD